MTENRQQQQSQWSRRRVLGVSLAAVGTAALGGRAVNSAAQISAAPWRFDVVHDESVYVTMTTGERFTVSVRDRASGAELERHDGVSSLGLRDLGSSYVQFVDQA